MPLSCASCQVTCAFSLYLTGVDACAQRTRNPYLFAMPGSTFEQDFLTPVSLYGADAQGRRSGDASRCWVVQAEPVQAPPFAQAFVVEAVPVDAKAAQGMPVAAGTVAAGTVAAPGYGSSQGP